VSFALSVDVRNNVLPDVNSARTPHVPDHKTIRNTYISDPLRMVEGGRIESEEVARLLHLAEPTALLDGRSASAAS